MPPGLARTPPAATVEAVLAADQTRRYAEASGDRSPYTYDEAAARALGLPGPIAHGLLTLSLLAPMAREAAVGVEGAVLGVNYGFDRIRFLQPVRSGSRVRGRFILADAREKGGAGRWLLRYEVTVEIEGESKPALQATFLVLQIVSV